MTNESPQPAASESGQSESPGWLRLTGAVVAGIVAGVMFSDGLRGGASLANFVENTEQWGTLFWGEHWVFRAFASLIAALWTGFIAGVLGRWRGGRLGLLATLPAALVWLVLTLTGWGLPLHSSLADVHVPLGYKLVGILLVPGIPFAGWTGGNIGAALGKQYADHFDSRPHTLLGIKWYHYLWLPFLLQFLLVMLTVAWLYGFEWLKVIWQSGAMFGPGAFVSTLFAMGLWACVYLLWESGHNTYRLLAGFRDELEKSTWRKELAKYGLGYSLGAGALQVAIIAIHAGLAELLG